MEITTTHDTIEGKIQTSTVFCRLNAIILNKSSFFILYLGMLKQYYE